MKAKILVFLIIAAIIEFAVVVIKPSKKMEGLPVVYITEDATVNIICPEKITYFSADKELEAKLANEKLLEVRMKEPGDSLFLVTVASKFYFVMYNFTYLPGKTGKEIETNVVMTEKERIDKLSEHYKKFMKSLKTF
jgi:hypothetical protein